MYQNSNQKTQRGNFHAKPTVACELCSGKTKRKAKKKYTEGQTIFFKGHGLG